MKTTLTFLSILFLIGCQNPTAPIPPDRTAKIEPKQSADMDSFVNSLTCNGIIELPYELRATITPAQCERLGVLVATYNLPLDTDGEDRDEPRPGYRFEDNSDPAPAGYYGDFDDDDGGNNFYIKIGGLVDKNTGAYLRSTECHAPYGQMARVYDANWNRSDLPGVSRFLRSHYLRGVSFHF